MKTSHQNPWYKILKAVAGVGVTAAFCAGIGMGGYFLGQQSTESIQQESGILLEKIQASSVSPKNEKEGEVADDVVILEDMERLLESPDMLFAKEKEAEAHVSFDIEIEPVEAKEWFASEDVMGKTLPDAHRITFLLENTSRDIQHWELLGCPAFTVYHLKGQMSVPTFFSGTGSCVTDITIPPGKKYALEDNFIHATPADINGLGSSPLENGDYAAYISLRNPETQETLTLEELFTLPQKDGDEEQEEPKQAPKSVEAYGRVSSLLVHGSSEALGANNQKIFEVVAGERQRIVGHEVIVGLSNPGVFPVEVSLLDCPNAAVLDGDKNPLRDVNVTPSDECPDDPVLLEEGEDIVWGGYTIAHKDEKGRTSPLPPGAYHLQIPMKERSGRPGSFMAAFSIDSLPVRHPSHIRAVQPEITLQAVDKNGHVLEGEFASQEQAGNQMHIVLKNTGEYPLEGELLTCDIQVIPQSKQEIQERIVVLKTQEQCDKTVIIPPQGVRDMGTFNVWMVKEGETNPLPPGDYNVIFQVLERDGTQTDVLFPFVREENIKG